MATARVFQGRARRTGPGSYQGPVVGRMGAAAGLVLLVIAGAWLGGCRAARVGESRDTYVHQGEVLHGRVPANRPRQAFTFEGVGPSLLDFTVQSDEGNQAAPRVRVFDPEGRELPVKKAVVSAVGAATLKVRDLVLVSSGTYRVVAEPAKATSRKGYYTFRHQLHFPGPVPKVMRLSAQRPQAVEFTAPRFGRVVASIKPRSRMRPDVMAVYDPDGGPALDVSRVPRGGIRPLVERDEDGTMILAFTAPKSGVYRLMAGAKPGCSGLGEVRVRIEPMKNESRRILHTGGTLADADLPSSFDARPRRGFRGIRGSAPSVPSGAMPSGGRPGTILPESLPGMVPAPPPPPPLYPYPSVPSAPGEPAPLGIDPNAQAYLQVPPPPPPPGR